MELNPIELMEKLTAEYAQFSNNITTLQEFKGIMEKFANRARRYHEDELFLMAPDVQDRVKNGILADSPVTTLLLEG